MSVESFETCWPTKHLTIDGVRRTATTLGFTLKSVLDPKRRHKSMERDGKRVPTDGWAESEVKVSDKLIWPSVVLQKICSWKSLVRVVYLKRKPRKQRFAQRAIAFCGIKTYSCRRKIRRLRKAGSGKKYPDVKIGRTGSNLCEEGTFTTFAVSGRLFYPRLDWSSSESVHVYVRWHRVVVCIVCKFFIHYVLRHIFGTVVPKLFFIQVRLGKAKQKTNEKMLTCVTHFPSSYYAIWFSRPKSRASFPQYGY